MNGAVALARRWPHEKRKDNNMIAKRWAKVKRFFGRLRRRWLERAVDRPFDRRASLALDRLLAKEGGR